VFERLIGRAIILVFIFYFVRVIVHEIAIKALNAFVSLLTIHPVLATIGILILCGLVIFGCDRVAKDLIKRIKF
jgi:hypothetical protein